MNIGYRIKTVRQLRGLTQKELGLRLGYTDGTADIRVSQYESGTRIPKKETIEKLADILKVSPRAFLVPHIDNLNDIVQILFALEDICGLSINVLDNRFCLTLNDFDSIATNGDLIKFFMSWKERSDAFDKRNISKEKYDDWRYNFSFDN